MKQVIIILCALIIISCSCQNNRVGYMPDGVFSNDQKRNDYILKWYVEHLIALQEPSLYEFSNDYQVHSYRFLWLRTFDNPIALRLLLKNDGSAILNVKVTNGKGGYNPGQLTENQTLNITKVQVDNFLELLNHANFWDLPTMDGKEGLDGTTWTLEGVKAGKYQLVVRWSPEEGHFQHAALFLLSLSNLDIDKAY